MLGRWVLASQTYRLYDAAGHQVPGSGVVGTIFFFYDLRAVFRALGGAKQGQKVTVPSYGSLPPNIRILSCRSGACYQ